MTGKGRRLVSSPRQDSLQIPRIRYAHALFEPSVAKQSSG